VEKVNAKKNRFGSAPDMTSTVVPGVPMIKKYIKRLIIVNKKAILMEVLSIKGLMQLLMKTRNTDEKWTREEKKEIKTHLKNIAKIIPAVAVFSLPGGSLLLPMLAEALDRRKTRKLLKKEDPGGTFNGNL
jgi:hypothetical protein